MEKIETARHTGNVYPIRAEGDVFRDTDKVDFDPNGSDLVVGTYAERLSNALKMLEAAERDSLAGNKIEARKILAELKLEAEKTNTELKMRYQKLSDKNRQAAQAVQDWVTAELRSRAKVLDETSDFTQPDSWPYDEIMSVLEDLKNELIDEANEAVGSSEYKTLIKLVSTWHDEVALDASIADIKKAMVVPVRGGNTSEVALAA